MDNRRFLIGILMMFLSFFVRAGDTRMIEPGDVLVKGTHLKPYLAHYRQYRPDDGKDTLVGVRLVHLQQARFPDGPGFRSVISMVGTDTVYDEHRFLKGDLSPVARVVSARSIVHQIEIYGRSTVQGAAVNGDGGEARPLSYVQEGPRFAGGVAAYLLAGLPLEKGFRAIFPVFSSDLGVEMANCHLLIEVIGRERITAGDDNTYDTWVIERRFLDNEKKPLQTPNGPFPPSTLWLSTKPPYQIKAEYGPMRVVLTYIREIPVIEEPR